MIKKAEKAGQLSVSPGKPKSPTRSQSPKSVYYTPPEYPASQSPKSVYYTPPEYPEEEEDQVAAVSDEPAEKCSAPNMRRALTQNNPVIFQELCESGVLQYFTGLKRLGKGAYGEVFAAKFEGMPVALKKFGGKNALDELASEFQAATRLSHKNLAKYYMGFAVPGAFYGVMELAKGKILTGFSSKSIQERCGRYSSVASQIFSALVYMHNEREVHRDLKPPNIMYDWDTDHVTIIDYGYGCVAPCSVLPSAGVTYEYWFPDVAVTRFSQKISSDRSLRAYKANDTYGATVSLREFFLGRFVKFGPEFTALRNARKNNVRLTETQLERGQGEVMRELIYLGVTDSILVSQVAGMGLGRPLGQWNSTEPMDGFPMPADMLALIKH